MPRKSALNFKSLKEQVYDYLRERMEIGAIRPGAVINMEETSKELGVSRTPLRDALLQLEAENFVSILPRRGVVVNVLTLEDIKSYYEILGALESASLFSCFDRIRATDIQKLKTLNEKMARAIAGNDFNSYYQSNLKFHNVFLDLCGNKLLKKMVNNLKRKLYDFPRQQGFVKEWEESSIQEHQNLVDLIEKGKSQEASNYIRDVHWSYAVQEKFIQKYYSHAASLADSEEAKWPKE
ncbi:MAG: GntR family transcriptional regulator [Candidatus Aminicenantes bacterium]|jgi:DNA-binding GntR family transcriptional regulator